MVETILWVVFPDTHGHLREVEAILAYCRKNGLLPGHRLLFLGDYFDRGMEVRGLLDLLVILQRKGHIFLAGKHEFVLRMTLNARHPFWSYWLGRWAVGHEDRTLQSYGVKRPSQDYYDNPAAWEQAAMELRQALPESHRNFLNSLPLFYETEEHIFVHAGLTMQPWAEQKEHLLTGNFNARLPEQIFSAKLAGEVAHGSDKLVVSGHRPFKVPVKTEKRLLLHCGVDYGGPLVAWVSDTNKFIVHGGIKK